MNDTEGKKTTIRRYLVITIYQWLILYCKILLLLNLAKHASKYLKNPIDSKSALQWLLSFFVML
jgi:hypothetical protein